MSKSGRGEHQGTTARGRFPEALHPDYFHLDERKTADFLKYMQELSKELVFFGPDDNPDGNWEDFLISDESFILADIASLDLADLEQKRSMAVQAFERHADPEAKQLAFTEIFDLVLALLEKTDRWYRQSSRFHRKREGGILEEELASAIDFQLRTLLHKLLAFDQQCAIIFPSWPGNTKRFEVFHGIWRLTPQEEASNMERPPDFEHPENALKQLLLIYRPVYLTVASIVAKAPDLLQQTVEKNDRHAPHIGLILAFLEVYGLVQRDLNQLTRRHLYFFYNHVLRQHPADRKLDRVYVLFSAAPEYQQIMLRAGTRLLAGQNPDGQNRFYALERDLVVSHARVTSLKTLFVSRDPNVDQYSRYRLVSGLYASPVANSATGIGPESVDLKDGWPSLGEEQRYLGITERTMQDAQVGFAISSATLKLDSGEREITLEFVFTTTSLAFLQDLLQDIAQKRGVHPEEVFHDIFEASLKVEYSGTKGWEPVEEYRFLSPGNWQNQGFTLGFFLEPSAPGIAPYREEVHLSGYPIELPVVRVLLQGMDSNHPYSFLQVLELEEIKINVHVAGLRNLAAHNLFGPLDVNQPVELFGPIPRRGAAFLVGHEELFCKPLHRLQIGWTYDALPVETGGLAAYYAGYGRGIRNDSFRVSLSALSNFSWFPEQPADRQEFDLFDVQEDPPWVPVRTFRNIDLKKLQLKPDPNFLAPLEANTPSLLPKGLLRFELTNPAIGFGFDIFPKIFAEAVAANAQSKKPVREVPNQPIAPRIKDIKISYEARSTLVFQPGRAYENTPDSGDVFMHITPFGSRRIFYEGKGTSNALVPVFMNEGELYIGISGVQLPQTVNLLFELTRSGKWEFGQTLYLQWHYLSFDEWKPFPAECILVDGTKGLIETGILSIELVEEMTMNNEILPGDSYWIKATIPEKAELLSRINRIFVHAAVAINASQVREAPDFTGVPSFSIKAFEQPVPGIVEIQQPFPAFGGYPVESEEEYFVRVSESLRHKKRCITRWDFEHIALDQFKWLSQVKCIGGQELDGLAEEGEVVIVAMPKVEQTDRFYEPKLSPGEIKEIEDHLKKYCSPFLRLVVRNPGYEYVRLKCRLRLESDAPGLALKTLQQDILHFICPWFYARDVQASIGGAIKRAELIKFVQSRPYVGYVTGISTLQFQLNVNGEYTMRDSALFDTENDLIQGGTPWSVLVPSQFHDFTLVEKDHYAAPEPTSFSDLRIGYNLIIPGNDIWTPETQMPAAVPMEPDEDGSFEFSISF